MYVIGFSRVTVIFKAVVIIRERRPVCLPSLQWIFFSLLFNIVSPNETVNPQLNPIRGHTQCHQLHGHRESAPQSTCSNNKRLKATS